MIRARLRLTTGPWAAAARAGNLDPPELTEGREEARGDPHWRQTPGREAIVEIDMLGGSAESAGTW